MSTYERIVEDFKIKCQKIISNHNPAAAESIGGISRVNSVVTGMGAQLSDVNTEITEVINKILKAHSNDTEIDTANLKDNLLAIGKEMTAEYIKNNKLK